MPLWPQIKFCFPHPDKAAVLDSLAALPLHLMPKQALTWLFGRMAESKSRRLSQAMIRRFIARYGVNMDEAAEPLPSNYATFNEFFTRALRSDARPLADAPWICPVDGAISQCGSIEGDQIFQAKGHQYSARALLGGDAALSDLFTGGAFATLYLSPKDYHRIHMPCDARLTRMQHVPGALFPVNPQSARAVPGLFARNERVVNLFDSSHGPFALVLVGATIVGSMATVWHGTVAPPRGPTMRLWQYRDRRIELKQGQEMGRFLLGSTVVLLFPRGRLQFAAHWRPGQAIRMGEAMALALS
jgi:phosphatidylserine decarboxylase